MHPPPPRVPAALIREVAATLFTLPYKTWNFGDSVAFEGLLGAWRYFDDAQYLRFAQGWFRAWATRAEPYRRLDCTAPGLAIVDVAEATDDAELHDAAVDLADYLVSRPKLSSGLFATWEHSPLQKPYGPHQLNATGRRLLDDPPAGAFIDCLHFDPPFLTAIGRVAGRPDLTEAGIEQALAYMQRLQTPLGLFGHFELEGEEATFGHGWGRGQGWALLGLLDVLQQTRGLEVGTAAAAIESAARRLIDAMIALQREDGHWPIDLLDARSGDEYSTAAFMATGFRRAVRGGLFDTANARERVSNAADAAENAVLAALDASGHLSVSAAVMACTTNSHYANVPTGFTVPWGQGPLVLMLTEARQS